jgi:His-Xaa-Ser system radical SAM maturase HxsC
MLLGDRTNAKWNEPPFVVRVTTDASRPFPLRAVEALLVRGPALGHPLGFKVLLSLDDSLTTSQHEDAHVVALPSTLSYIQDGDIMVVRPMSGDLRVLYRKTSRHNSLMVTPTCNNLCIMCSQPPRRADDEIFRLVWDAIPLMDIDTPGLILSGGEPTLLGRRLVSLVRRLKSYLPSTSVHILTNGRQLKFLAFAQDIAEVEHSDLVLGIPLYSDLSHEHDFVVQAHGAFDETARGILNAARCGLRVELRIVITKINFKWLPRISRFISRNFPFACHVAFMGLEPIGLAKVNLRDVWIDPADYGDLLSEAVQELKWHRIPVSVYNHQLCTISRSLWGDSRQSISDWKNVFLPECNECSMRESCCGLFASATEVHSKAIMPIRAVIDPIRCSLGE